MVTLRQVTDRSLPPDHAAFVAAEPPTGRIIVIAPTRAACETIELALTLHVDTVLERSHGDAIRDLARAGKGFGIVAGTGTGKTLAIRPIAETILGTTDLRIGVVNREREATPETPTWNVIIITTGIARRWFQDGDILPLDTLIVDEIHQTSAELELCLALGKRVGCRFIWLSATVDPSFYSAWLQSAHVIESTAFDPRRAARVKVVRADPARFLDDRFLQQVTREKRGVGMFLPTRAAVEEVAQLVGERFGRITTAFYHGGEPIRAIRPFLEEGVTRPFFLAMTAAGQSALNIRGLDTVVIDDTRFANVVERGRNVLTRLHLGTNEILQMAGRVHGRVENGRVFILSDRDLEFNSLRPTAPEFQLAGDSERIAITCAALGVDPTDLDLPVPLDRAAWTRAVAGLEARGIVENGRLSRYGRTVEALPVDRPWAELIAQGDDELLPCLAIMASLESLHRMTREERDLEGLIVAGSDHLTAYAVYAEAFARAGYVGEVYGLPRHLFDEVIISRWAERRGVLVKAIEDAALAAASVYRAVGLPLPTSLRRPDQGILRRFSDLVARMMPFDLVIDEQTADGQEARVSRTSVCSSSGAIAGTLRYFADRTGTARASIEGTQLHPATVRYHAVRGPRVIEYDAGRDRDAIRVRRSLDYFGFELERESDYIDEFPGDLADEARKVLAEALAREEARHPAVRRNRAEIAEARELYKRSGASGPRLSYSDLTGYYSELLAQVRSVSEYRRSPLRLDLSSLWGDDDRQRLLALPSEAIVAGVSVPLDYDIEESRTGEILPVVRVTLPERLARKLSDSELPVLDRAVRLVVQRGRSQGGTVAAPTLSELQVALDRRPDAEESGASRRRERDDDWRRRQRDRHQRPASDKRADRRSRDGARVDPSRRRRRGR
ncbi:MAG: DEAD/DEAH box helicase [Gemmatimonadota bacterium]